MALIRHNLRTEIEIYRKEVALSQGGLTGALFGAAGLAGGSGAEGADTYARYAAHAGAGCVSSVAGGGSCGQGAVSAVFGKFTTNAIGGTQGQFNGYQMAATTVAGGVGSMIAGGKFENGATTAAFGYLFNQLGPRFQKPGQLCGPEMCAGDGGGGGGGQLGREIGIVREANLIKGNVTLSGEVTRAEIDAIGKTWVGPGYRATSDGSGLVSADALRVYRAPALKPNSPYATTGVQANLEQKLAPGTRPFSNAHINVTP